MRDRTHEQARARWVHVESAAVRGGSRPWQSKLEPTLSQEAGKVLHGEEGMEFIEEEVSVKTSSWRCHNINHLYDPVSTHHVCMQIGWEDCTQETKTTEEHGDAAMPRAHSLTHRIAFNYPGKGSHFSEIAAACSCRG